MSKEAKLFKELLNLTEFNFMILAIMYHEFRDTISPIDLEVIEAMLALAED